MAQEKKKLENLCHLLDNILIQHNDTEATSNLSKDTVKCPQKPVQKNSPKNTPPVPPANTAKESNEEKSKEQIELERKARKDAKKSRKKGGEKRPSESKEETKNEGSKQNKKGKGSMQVKESSKENKSMNEVKPVQAAGNDPDKKVENTKKVQEQMKEKQQGPGPSGEGDGAKSKADLKKERREKQEAQRRAKLAQKAKQEEEKQPKKKAETQATNKPSTVEKKKKNVGEGGRGGREKKGSDKKSGQRRIPLLGHLTPPVTQAPQAPVNCDTIHPAVRTLGIKMKDRVIDGSTARVLSTLAALKRLISDYRTPESCDLSRDMAEQLAPNVEYLNACRPQAVAMDNAIRFLKHKVNSIAPSMPEGQAKDELRTAIDDYVRENISLASSTIASHAISLIQPSDVILTFGYSALVCEMVEATCKSGNRVSVVVADSPHPPSGLAMVQRLAALGVTTYYRLITDITNIMDKVTKVVVEAEAVMMNGAIQGLCGTTSLALAAATHHKPFIVLCHTYKFCNNDLTDSLVVNELGDADKVVWGPTGAHSGLLAGWRDTHNLNVVSLVYDVTPASMVTALVTEQSVLPTTAVPVIIRRNYADVLGQD